MLLSTLLLFLFLQIVISEELVPNSTLEPSGTLITPLPSLEIRDDPLAPAVPGAPALASTGLPPATPMPTTSTVYVDTVIGGTRTQVPIVFTQTFAKIPSQGPTPEPGTIGLGILTKGGAAASGKVKRSNGAALLDRLWRLQDKAMD